MAMAVRFGLALALVSAAAATGEAADGKRSSATPISKVLEMMEEMAVKGEAEMKAEKVRFTTFYQWCTDQTRIKNNEITKATEKMAKLSAAIESATAHIKELTARIQELDEDIARWTKDRKSARDVREKEKADYVATAADYTESLTALDGAILVLRKQEAGKPQAELVQESLLQVHRLRLVPISTKKALVSFLQQPSVEEMPDERLLRSAPEAYGYEFQSSGVVEMLEKLKDQFQGQKYELDKDEKTAQHSYDQIMQQLTDNEENAQHEVDKKTALRAKTEQEKADLEADLAQTTADRAEDQKYLDEMTALCETKKADFESREQLRADELAAIREAIEIISGQAVKGTGEKYLPENMPALSQVGGVALVQSSSRQTATQVQLAAFFSERAKRYNSRLLAALSTEISGNPFVKVKKMIKDLIWKLMEEATAETEHKGWCDTELGTNKQTRDQKTAQLNELTATEEDLTAELAQLTQEIEELTEAITQLEAEMAEATEDRATSKATNEQTIADAKAAQEAVTNAMAVLKDFYASSAEATALVQQQGPAEATALIQQGPVKEVDGVYYEREATDPEKDAPETFEKSYKGMLPEGGNVVDFLEVILTDFARLESETASDEATELAEYKKYMNESEQDKALKETEKRQKEGKKTDQTTALQQTQEDMRTTEEALNAAIAYYEKLKPTCVDSGVTYEDRVKRREAEMQSLKEALGILQGTDIDLA